MFNENNIFLLNPENKIFLHSKNRKIHDGDTRVLVQSLAIGLIFFSILAVVFLWTSFNEHFLLMELEKRGVSSTAEVIDLHVNSGKWVTYNVEYRFWVNGQPYQHKNQIAREIYHQLEVGGLISISYFSDDPTISRPSGAVDDLNMGMILLMLVFPVGFAIAWYRNLCVLLQNRRFEKEGQLITGEIIDYKYDLGRNNKINASVHYRFVSPTGVTLEGNNYYMRRPYIENGSIADKTHVVVIYIDDDTYRIL